MRLHREHNELTGYVYLDEFICTCLENKRASTLNLNEAKMMKSCSEASFNDNPKVHFSQWYYNCVPVLMKIGANLFSSIHVRGMRKIREKRTIQNILIKPQLCTKHIRAKSVLWKQVSSCVK